MLGVATLGQRRSGPSHPRGWSMDQQHQHHLEAKSRAPPQTYRMGICNSPAGLECTGNFKMPCSGMQACPNLLSSSPCGKVYRDSGKPSSSSVTHWRGKPKAPDVSLELAAHVLATCWLLWRPPGWPPPWIPKT